MQRFEHTIFASPFMRSITIALIAIATTGCWSEIEYTKPDPSATGRQESQPDEPVDIKLPNDNQVVADPTPPARSRPVPAATTPPARSTPAPQSTSPLDDLYATDDQPSDDTMSDSMFPEPDDSNTMAADPLSADPPAADLEGDDAWDDLFVEESADSVATSESPPSPESDSGLPTLPEFAEQELPDIADLFDTDSLEAELFGKNGDPPSLQTQSPDDPPPALPSGTMPGDMMFSDEPMQSADSTARTRRMAWLLGSKLSLSALAYDRGAPAESVAEWFSQARTLALSLGTSITDLPPRPNAITGPVGGQTLDYLFQLGQSVGRDLAQLQGPDHAALFEVALKSNVLLVLYEPGDSLVDAVATAIKSAGMRAKLPATIWQPLIDKIDSDAPDIEVQQAVFALHEAVDTYLGPSLEASQNSAESNSESRF